MYVGMWVCGEPDTFLGPVFNWSSLRRNFFDDAPKGRYVGGY